MDRRRSEECEHVAHATTDRGCFHYTDGDFAYAARHRLGLKPHALFPTNACCGVRTALTSDHYQWCKKLRGSYVTDRHNTLRDTLMTLAHEAGCRAWAEPRVQPEARYAASRRRLGIDDGKDVDLRVDLLINGKLPDTRCMVDISIIHTASPSYVKDGKKGRFAAEREKDKERKYGDYASECGFELVPFVLESHGKLGAQAIALLHTLAEESSKEEAIVNAFFRRALTACSFALQRGNAHIYSMGVLRQRNARMRGKATLRQASLSLA